MGGIEWREVGLITVEASRAMSPAGTVLLAVAVESIPDDAHLIRFLNSAGHGWLADLLHYYRRRPRWKSGPIGMLDTRDARRLARVLGKNLRRYAS
jgi:hypothetical protein